MAINDAKAKGVSLNVYIEELIRQAHQRGETPQLVGLFDEAAADTLATVEAVTVEEAAARFAAGETLEQEQTRTDEKAFRESVVATWPAVPKEFARNCRNGTLHWKSGPGNPCRFCGGEI